MPELSSIAPDLLSHVRRPADTVAVFAGGPAVGAHAGEVGALDIRVVTAAPWLPADARVLRLPVEPGRVAALTTGIGTRRCAVTYWTEGQLHDVLAKAAPDRLATAGVAPLLVEAEELLLESLLTGVALYGHDHVAVWRELAERSAFRDIAITRSLGDAEGSVEDAVGQLASGDLHSAVLSARKAFGHCVDALLESYGRYGTYAPERRAERFLEAAPDELGFDEYWAVETMAGLGPENAGAWVESVVSCCGRLMAVHPERLRRAALRGPRRGW